MITGEQPGSAAFQMQPMGLHELCWPNSSESAWVAFSAFSREFKGNIEQIYKAMLLFSKLRKKKSANISAKKGASACLVGQELGLAKFDVWCILHAVSRLWFQKNTMLRAFRPLTLGIPSTPLCLHSTSVCFSNTGLNLHCAEMWGSESNETSPVWWRMFLNFSFSQAVLRTQGSVTLS